jgi:hypothetical protein
MTDCKRKITYNSITEAETALSTIQSKDGYSGTDNYYDNYASGEKRVYYCDECGKYHITSKDGK